MKLLKITGDDAVGATVTTASSGLKATLSTDSGAPFRSTRNMELLSFKVLRLLV
jgi:hypothetical protein